MHRYWIFPLVMASFGSVLPFICFLVGAFPTVLAFYPPFSSNTAGLTLNSFWQGKPEMFWHSAPVGAMIGLVIGLLAAVWDQVRNGLVDRSGVKASSRLVPNLWWCSFYAFIPLLVNYLACWYYFHKFSLTAFRSIPNYYFLAAYPIAATVLACLTAVVWGVLRSINSVNILTPRVLLNKLRRTTRLQET